MTAILATKLWRAGCHSYVSMLITAMSMVCLLYPPLYVVLGQENWSVINKVYTNRLVYFYRARLCYARYMPSSCVCVSVCVSVTLRYCIKTAKRRITQTTPHDSPMTLVFWCQRSCRNSNGITPYGGDKCRWGGLKFTFDENRAITRKRYKIDAYFLLKSNRKSYALYQMVMFPMTLGDP